MKHFQYLNIVIISCFFFSELNLTQSIDMIQDRGKQSQGDQSFTKVCLKENKDLNCDTSIKKGRERRDRNLQRGELQNLQTNQIGIVDEREETHMSSDPDLKIDWQCQNSRNRLELEENLIFYVFIKQFCVSGNFLNLTFIIINFVLLLFYIVIILKVEIFCQNL